MDFTVLIMTAVLLLTLASPFAIWYGVSLAKRKAYKTHRRVQNTIFFICVLGVLALEMLIRYSGGSGSLASKSVYYGSGLFTFTLVSHIIVAVLSYLLWTILIVFSNIKFQAQLPGTFSGLHQKMAYGVFGGLIYTALSALAVYVMTLNLI